ncbi:MAG: hypothetical protein LC624_00975 [Halobacteriales archaeon]|nr:hypothetical protein [Halobacteriales archaeon]
MVVTTLAVSAAFGIIEALVFVYVGVELRKRKVEGEAATAWNLFVLWWLGLGALVLVSGLQTLAVAAGYVNLAAHVTFTYLALMVLAVALWGFVYYLLYVYTGKRSLLAPLTVFYAGVLAGLVYFVVVQDPYDVAVKEWSVTLLYRQPVTGPAYAALIGAVLLPELLVGIAYGTLYFKVNDRSQRYRIALVSVATTVWFGSSLVQNVAGASQSDFWQVANKFIGLGAALVILAAYRPPAWVRRRGITAVANGQGRDAAFEEVAEPAPPPRTHGRGHAQSR